MCTIRCNHIHNTHANKKNTHPPLGNRTTTAGSCVRSNLGSPSHRGKIVVTPKVPKEKGDDIRAWGGCLFCDISILVPMMWLICWKISGIVYLAWKFLTLLFQWGGRKGCLYQQSSAGWCAQQETARFRVSRQGHVFFPMFYKRFPMSRSLNVINMSWPGLWVPISRGHCLLWTNNFTWPSCKKKANGLLVTFLSAAFPMDRWSFKPSSNCWY